MPDQKYQRLARARSRSTFAFAYMSRSSLWLGRDHLLCIDSSGYTETYKRFYFRDIQTISLMESKRRVVWNWTLAVPTTLCLALLLADLVSRAYWEHGMTLVYAIFSFVFGVPFLINIFWGPTCICHLRTAVQIEELPSLNRLRRARRVLEQIRPLIIAAQGELTAEAISSRMRATAGAPAGATIAAGTSAPPVGPEAPPIPS